MEIPLARDERLILRAILEKVIDALGSATTG